MIHFLNFCPFYGERVDFICENSLKVLFYSSEMVLPVYYHILKCHCDRKEKVSPLPN